MMDQQVFERFRSIIYKESGIVISPEKLPLLSNRINKRLSRLGIHDEREYLQILETELDGEELIQLIDVVSTNVTHFYRESAHFQTYRDYLKELTTQANRAIKVWCAAASSGEEPYTLAFESNEVLAPLSIDFRILATDICTKVLNTALNRTYSDAAVAPIPNDLRNKYLTPIIEGGEQVWQVKEAISSHVLFKRMNLVSFPYPVKGPIDVIFCRNVMIYFDQTTRRKILEQFYRVMRPNALLVVSHSENLIGMDHQFEKITGSVFKKRGHER